LKTKASQGNYSTQIVIAALNEEEGIGPTIAEMMDTLDDPPVIVIDGKSSDRTVEIAQSLGAIVDVQDGLGKGDAFAKALAHLDPNVDFVVITDADFTYPAGVIPEMIRLLKENPQVGMVCGNRLNGNVDPNALHDVFHFGNKLIAFTHNLLNGVPLKDPLTGLRVVRTCILKNWKIKSKGFDIEVELNHRVEREGFGILEVPIQYRERLGVKKLKVRNAAEIIKRILLETTY
jgi:dolichol-phosphate hexosyltransferase